MKKLFCIFWLIIVLISMLTSCKDETNISPQLQSSTETVSYASSSIDDLTTSSDIENTEKPEENHKYDSECLVYVGVKEQPVKPDKTKTYIEIDGVGIFETDKNGNVFINEYTVSDFKGDVVYFYKNPIDKCLVVFSHDSDGKVYVNSYNSNGDKCSYNNKAIIFKKVDSNVSYSKVNKIKFSNTSTAGFISEINGKYYHNKVSLSLGDEPTLEIIGIENCKNVYGLGYRNPYSVVCYSKKNVDDTVFYKCGSIEYDIKLPDGYKISDIKELYFGSVVVFELNDGNICTVNAGRNANSYTLTVNEVITTLKINNNYNVCILLMLMAILRYMPIWTTAMFIE